MREFPRFAKHPKPRCRWHAIEMLPETADVPRFVASALGWSGKHLSRRIWHCPCAGCRFVAVGEMENLPMFWQKRQKSANHYAGAER